MSKNQPSIHLALVVLMLLMLVIPLPWASSETGDYLIGLYFVVSPWGLIPRLVLWPPTLGHFLSLNWLFFSGGFAFLILANLLSAVSTQLSLGWLRRTLVVIILLSALLLGLWLSSVFLDIGFWLAAGLVGIDGLIELVVYLKSGSERSNISSG